MVWTTVYNGPTSQSNSMKNIPSAEARRLGGLSNNSRAAERRHPPTARPVCREFKATAKTACPGGRCRLFVAVTSQQRALFAQLPGRRTLSPVVSERGKQVDNEAKAVTLAS